MARPPIPETLLAAIRQEYLGSDISIRALAQKHSVSQTKLFTLAKEQGWKEEHDKIANCSNVYSLIKAADKRALTIATGWRDRLESLMDMLTDVCHQQMNSLKGQPTPDFTPADRATMMRIMSGCLKDIRAIMPAADPRETPDAVTIIFPSMPGGE